MYRENNYNKKYDREDEAPRRRKPRQSPAKVVKRDAVFRQTQAPYEEPAQPPHPRKSRGRRDAEYDVFYEEPKRAKREKSRKNKKDRDYGEAKRRRPLRKILIILGALLLLLLALWCYLLGGLDTKPFPKDDESLGITESGKIGVTNIAFFGVDTRDDTDTGRSDAMMILTVNELDGTVKMTSLLRDTKVPIEGHGETKLNHAYAYGGAELAVKTINQNFHTDIKEYATVNFNQLSQIVDAVGGVTQEITEAERQNINGLLDDQFPGSPHVESAGTVVLDGNQAISYSRIRHIDSDNARTGRQQDILSGIFASVKNMHVWEYPAFVRNMCSIMDTSLNTFDILKLSPIIFRDYTIERYTIPDAAYETDLAGYKDSDGLWYWHYDLDAAVKRLHTIIYGE